MSERQSAVVRGLLVLLLASPLGAAPVGDRQLRGEYLRILASYAAGGEESAAVETLGALEEAFLGDPRSGIRALGSRQLGIARRLAEADPRALVPVFFLHFRAYGDHFARGRFALAGHSREVTLELADLAGRALPEGGERTLIADALVILADQATRERMLFHGEAMLRRAIAVDPGHLTARLRLGIHYEWLGRFEAARDAFRGLIEVDPSNREGRLRLAVNFERCGEPEESIRLARQLVAEPTTDWVLAVAYQTLAAGLGREERFAEAAAVLEEAISRLPGDQGLVVQHSYFLERAGRSAEALEALAVLTSGEGSFAETPRRRYTRAPDAALKQVRGRLAADLPPLLPRLARALAERFPESGTEP